MNLLTYNFGIKDNFEQGGIVPLTGMHFTVAPQSGSLLSLSDPVYMSRKIQIFERINSIRETNGNFDSCNSCKLLGTSSLHELHESKSPLVSRIEFMRSKLSNFSAHVYGVSVCFAPSDREVN